jgi:hypothetical protein
MEHFYTKKNNNFLGTVVPTYNSSYLGGGGRRIENSRPVEVKLTRPFQNKIKTKGLGWSSNESGFTV